MVDLLPGCMLVSELTSMFMRHKDEEIMKSPRAGSLYRFACVMKLYEQRVIGAHHGSDMVIEIL